MVSFDLCSRLHLIEKCLAVVAVVILYCLPKNANVWWLAVFRTGAVNAASGSAYAEFGNTKVIVSVWVILLSYNCMTYWNQLAEVCFLTVFVCPVLCLMWIFYLHFFFRFGPRESKKAMMYSDIGRLNCNVSFTTFATPVRGQV